MSSTADSWTSIPFTDPALAAFPGLPAPPALEVADDGKTLRMDCTGKKDWWRVPYDNGKPRDDANGPAWGMKRKIGKKGFEVRCEVGVDASLQFLFYLSATEWVKVGVEYDNDALWCGVVVCNPFSDWSIQPPPTGPTVFTISYDPSTTTLRVYLNDVMMREVKSFGIYSAGGTDGRSALSGATASASASSAQNPAEVLAEKEVWIGAMACSPLGSEKEGEMARATFRDLAVRDGTR